MIEDLLNKLNEDLGKQDAPRLLLAVSGGMDSMVMWYLIHQLKFPYAIAHVNYQLRGEESDGDQDLVERLAKERGVDCHVHKANTRHLAENWNKSIQEAARKIRYEFFDDLLANKGYTHVLTAHHLDDSIETVFINVNRGTGLKGLLGIKERGNILRPLLDTPKSTIVDVAKSMELEYRDDSSNFEVNYLRNFFRLEIIPKWKKRNPQFVETMQANMGRFKEVFNVVDQAVKEDLSLINKELEKSSIEYNTIAQLKCPKFSLLEALHPYGFNAIQIESMMKAYLENPSGKKFFSTTHQINLDRDKALIQEINDDIPNREYYLDLENQRVNLPFELNLEVVDVNEVDYKKPNTYYLDLGLIDFPLKLRRWQAGDKIQPLGMKGSKKISDILIDRKVPVQEKEKVCLIENKNDVCLVLGYGISEKFKLNNETKKALKVTWKK